MEMSNQKIKYLFLDLNSPQEVWNYMRYRIFLKEGIDIGQRSS